MLLVFFSIILHHAFLCLHLGTSVGSLIHCLYFHLDKDKSESFKGKYTQTEKKVNRLTREIP